MFVKICGITRIEDAEVAVRAGAGALGFVFWRGSPRYIEPDAARDIAGHLPPFVATVGVFVNQELSEIGGIVRRVGLSVVQLHGDEGPDFAAAIDRPVLRAVTSSDQLEAAARWPVRVMPIVDARDPERRGGTGTRADWQAAGVLARQRPTVLAGGLTPDNVREAIAAVRPFGIDVSSGVESAPGIKDATRMRALFEAL